jgi:alpha-ketoglutarate-dependent taurine dioxygenase
MINEAPTIKPRLGGILRGDRHAVRISDESLVRIEPLHPGWAVPEVIAPTADGVELAAWAEGHRDLIEELLIRHRALVFRGFHVRTVEQFQRFVAASSTGDPLEYRDRSTPRPAVGEKIYVSTIYPARERIQPHNEGTYWCTWARKIYFCCLQAPERGGETPIIDVRKVLSRIDPEVRQRFEEKGVLYQRNYNDGFGLPWQDAFQTDDRDEVEAYCHEHEIETEWKEGDRLRTRQVRPAVRIHPVSGETVWFNHAAFFHISSLEEEVKRSLLADFGEDGLPYNTYFGDGSPIDPAVVSHLREAYQKEMVMFPWCEGDVMLLDNMTMAHAREPYEGERKVIVAMTEPVTAGQAV